MTSTKATTSRRALVSSRSTGESCCIAIAIPPKYANIQSGHSSATRKSTPTQRITTPSAGWSPAGPATRSLSRNSLPSTA